MDWKPISELKQTKKDISSFGYSKEYIHKHDLHGRKTLICSNLITGQVDFFEPLEVKTDGKTVFYRESNGPRFRERIDIFETQYGVFNNHNNGEFFSWLEKGDYELSGRDRELHRLHGRDDFYIKGNYCDMFDCGKFSYAVSNLMHAGLGDFKIIRIDQNLEPITMYDNSLLACSPSGGWTRLKYIGRFKNKYGYVIIASGFTEIKHSQGEKRDFQKETLLFQIDTDGTCTINKKWQMEISSSNSMVTFGNFAYFGQNKMVTRLNLSTGEPAYFTNKTDEELKVLKPMWGHRC